MASVGWKVVIRCTVTSIDHSGTPRSLFLGKTKTTRSWSVRRCHSTDDSAKQWAVVAWAVLMWAVIYSSTSLVIFPDCCKITPRFLFNCNSKYIKTIQLVAHHQTGYATRTVLTTGQVHLRWWHFASWVHRPLCLPSGMNVADYRPPSRTSPNKPPRLCYRQPRRTASTMNVPVHCRTDKTFPFPDPVSLFRDQLLRSVLDWVFAPNVNWLPDQQLV